MSASRQRSVVITPTVAGGLGDQAMVDVLVAQANALFGRPPVVAPNAHTVRTPSHIVNFASGPLERVRLFVKTARARRVLMIGADVLDGHYGPKLIGRRLTLARFAHLAGARVRVVGCSFSTRPHPETIARLKRMTWLEILARDPVSKARMEAALGREVPLVADVAFLLEPAIDTEPARAAAQWIDGQRQAGRRVFALNVSGLVFGKLPGDRLERYAETVAARLAEAGDVAALVLPHDWRPDRVGDLGACRVLHAAVAARLGAACHLVEQPIHAWNAKALGGLVDAALLCRMHFAIACLGQGTPPYCLVSAGKFEGLMQHFGLSGNLFDPEDFDGEDALAAPVARMLDHWQEDAETARSALPDVLALSRENFKDLA